MKIAFTSQNFRTITGHAGKCNRFLILEQGADGGLREAARIDLPSEMAFHSFAGGPHPVDGCAVLVTQSCGQGFIQNWRPGTSPSSSPASPTRGRPRQSC